MKIFVIFCNFQYLSEFYEPAQLNAELGKVLLYECRIFENSLIKNVVKWLLKFDLWARTGRNPRFCDESTWKTRWLSNDLNRRIPGIPIRPSSNKNSVRSHRWGCFCSWTSRNLTKKLIQLFYYNQLLIFKTHLLADRVQARKVFWKCRVSNPGPLD